MGNERWKAWISFLTFVNIVIWNLCGTGILSGINNIKESDKRMQSFSSKKYPIYF